MTKVVLKIILPGDWVVPDGCDICDPEDTREGVILVGAISEGYIRFMRRNGTRYPYVTLAKIGVEHVRPATPREILAARQSALYTILQKNPYHD